jgi:hypothetical protein
MFSLGVMTAIEVLPTLPATKGFWMAHIGTEIFWPWFTLIGALLTLSAAWVMSNLGGPKPSSSSALTNGPR